MGAIKIIADYRRVTIEVFYVRYRLLCRRRSPGRRYPQGVVAAVGHDIGVKQPDTPVSLLGHVSCAHEAARRWVLGLGQAMVDGQVDSPRMKVRLQGWPANGSNPLRVSGPRQAVPDGSGIHSR